MSRGDPEIPGTPSDLAVFAERRGFAALYVDRPPFGQSLPDSNAPQHERIVDSRADARGCARSVSKPSRGEERGLRRESRQSLDDRTPRAATRAGARRAPHRKGDESPRTAGRGRPHRGSAGGLPGRRRPRDASGSVGSGFDSQAAAESQISERMLRAIRSGERKASTKVLLAIVEGLRRITSSWDSDILGRS